ncbi:sensor histidine kinase [Rhodopirellula islandica]|nr:ATP-binding protein [Rhodopirellula islandica]
MTTKQINALRMRQILIKRFGIAIGIIFATIILAFICESEQIRKADEDAFLVNVSGRQRMLSQRIALASRALLLSDSPRFEASCRTELSDSIQLMRQSHEFLLQDVQTSPGRNAIYLGEGRLDSQIKDYLRSAEEALATSNRNVTDHLARVAFDGPMLGLLDQVVTEHQSDAENRIQAFGTYKAVLTLISLGTLFALVWFVFQPTVALVTHNLEYLEKSNAELIEFTYRMSHDLRSPVVSSRCLSQLAIKLLDEDDPQEAKEAMRRAETSLTKLSHTIQDIVSLVKQSMTDPLVETVPLRSIIEEAVQHSRDLPGGDVIDFQVICDEQLQVQTKRVPLKQSIENLVSNAVKYRDINKQTSRITIEVITAKNDFELSICDNGLGIDPKFNDQIFGMFKRFHPHVSSGSGLGLYLVSKNVDSIDGSVGYRPTTDGSRFTIHFPSLGA